MSEPMENLPLTRASVEAAHKAISEYIHCTPVVTSKTLNDLASTPQVLEGGSQKPARPKIRLFFKCENYQKVGAFKSRGAFHALSRLSKDQLSKGVVTHSSATEEPERRVGRSVDRSTFKRQITVLLLLALAASTHGVKAYIVMPTISTPSKIAATKGYGAEVIFSGSTSQEREAVVEDVIKRTNATLIPPYDHVDIILGQGTMALELEEQVKEMLQHDRSLTVHGDDCKNENGHEVNVVQTRERQPGHLDAVIAPLGGGGMLSGIATALCGTGTKVFGAEPSFEGADDGRRGLEANERITSVKTLTIADGLRTPVGKINWTIISDKSKVKGVYAVSEEQILSAMRLVAERMKVFAEPSAVVILSGGNTTFEAISRLFAGGGKEAERAEGKVGMNGEKLAENVAG
ncbi:MAG: hypothetical protein Q9200_004042 [Gallowayella weberi]